jgi:hypothetical protein
VFVDWAAFLNVSDWLLRASCLVLCNSYFDNLQNTEHCSENTPRCENSVHTLLQHILVCFSAIRVNVLNIVSL